MPSLRVVALDNLRRRGSELNLPRLKISGVEFVHGDIRNAADLDLPFDVDLVIECSAEPSVLAGLTSSPAYVLDTNLLGTLNVLEYCRRRSAAILFLSTSRVYPMALLNSMKLEEGATRFEIADAQGIPGLSSRGVSESFPLTGARSLYGATKLASEMFLEEYRQAYGVPAIVNRCGVLAGPWQMGKVDQGFLVLWVARHVYGGRLSYIGFGGTGKQVRDVLHVEDLCDLVEMQIRRFEELDGAVLNIGGGRDVSVSLLELTDLCRAATGATIAIDAVAETRPADLPLYITDTSRAEAMLGWRPQRDVETLVRDTYDWIIRYRESLAPILAG